MNFYRAVLGTAGATVIAVGAGCGGPSESESVQRAPLPPVNSKTIDVNKITPVPQAAKFTGVQKDVAEGIDRVVEAINADDAKFMCTEGFSAANREVLNSKGNCVQGVKKIYGIYAGYRMDVSEIKVVGNTAYVKTRVTTGFKKEQKPIIQSVPTRFVKEDGQWRLQFDAQRGGGQGATGASGPQTKN